MVGKRKRGREEGKGWEIKEEGLDEEWEEKTDGGRARKVGVRRHEAKWESYDVTWEAVVIGNLTCIWFSLGQSQTVEVCWRLSFFRQLTSNINIQTVTQTNDRAKDNSVQISCLLNLTINLPSSRFEFEYMLPGQQVQSHLTLEELKDQGHFAPLTAINWLNWCFAGFVVLGYSFTFTQHLFWAACENCCAAWCHLQKAEVKSALCKCRPVTAARSVLVIPNGWGLQKRCRKENRWRGKVDVGLANNGEEKGCAKDGWMRVSYKN